MKLTRFVALAAIGLFAATAHVPAAAQNKPKGGDKAGNAGVLDKSLQIAPKGLRWGLSLEGVAKLYDKEFEQEMLPLFKRAQPGLELDALTEELKARQGSLRRTRIEFGSTPTGVDQSALKGEYSYNNGESMASLTLRSGTKRFFFFFNDRLWKVYDEYKLKKGGPLGENYQEALKSLAKRFGVTPKLQPSDFDKGRPFDEAEWRDPEKIIRAVDRGNTLGVVYTEREVQENLSRYRRNQPQVGGESLDKDVLAVTRKNEEAPAKDKDKEKDKKKK